MSNQENLSNFLKHLVTTNVLDLKTAQNISKDALFCHTPIITYIIKNNLLDATILAESTAQYFALPFIALEEYEISALPTNILNAHLIAQYQVLPLKLQDNQLLLAIADPTNAAAINAVKFHTALETKLAIVEYDKLMQLITTLLGKQQYQNLAHTKQEDVQIIQLIEQILNDAIIKGASDVHFEPYEKLFRVRFRIDGVLYQIANIDLELAPRFSSRLKVISNLNIAERRLPQDGRFSLSISNQQKRDCRISTCPTLFGEKIVIRILNPNNIALTIDQLGLTKIQKKIFLNHIHAPQGMILVTGPTGSGKTLTLYTALSILNTPERNISTAEDPIEINLPGINQVEINQKIGLNFSTGLRAFLRQDPDIIMVGEIRDLETAQIAIRAAQTGHLVLATLHTNSAAEAITRLVSMGVAPFNLANSMTLIIAQRLLRKLCTQCKTFHPAAGCKHCQHGYSGRVGVFECMPISKILSTMITQSAPSNEIEHQAHREGMLGLREAALTLEKQGMTSLQEINRVIC